MNQGRVGLTIFRVLVGLICWVAGLAAAGILFWQTTTWLKAAYWNPYTIADAFRDLGFGYPYFPNLLGVQKIIDDVLTWPAVAVYLTVAFVAGYCWVQAVEAGARLDREEWLAKREKERRGQPETLEGLAAEFENLHGKQKR